MLGSLRVAGAVQSSPVEDMELTPDEAELWNVYRRGTAYRANGATVRAEVVARLLLDSPTPVAGRAGARPEA